MLHSLFIMGIGTSLTLGGLKADECDKDPESALMLLRSGELELGVLPKVGGSAVLFRKKGSANVLYAPSDHWLDWEPKIPDPLDLSQWTDFFGHIIWLGPQVDFWNQQELIPQQKDQLWPPDPYWTYGNFKVVEQSEDHVVLEGPASPYTGVKMIKRYAVDEAGATLSVTAINVSDRVLRWGLWSNTRVTGDTEVYVPVQEGDTVHVMIEAPEPGVIPWSIDEGYFHFSGGIADRETSPHAKAYLYPDANWMAGFHAGQVFVKIMEPVGKSEVHPKHGVFEVYHLRPNLRTGLPGLNEMEAHGAYRELQPGDQMTLSEKWMIFSLPEEGETASEVSALQWLKDHREQLDAADAVQGLK